MKGYISNKQFKVIEGIIWTMATIGIIVLICALYELKEIKGDIKEYKIQRIK
jgi:hypothetical protein